jgi:hypothetical protein
LRGKYANLSFPFTLSVVLICVMWLRWLGEAHLRQILPCHAAYYNEVQPRAGSRSGNGQQ